MEKSLQEAFKNESQVRRIISDQTESGIQFNYRRGNKYVLHIERKQAQLYKRIRPLLQLEVVQPYTVPVNRPFKKDGSYSAMASGWFGDEVGIIGGQFSRVRFDEPDLGSRQKLQSQLLKLGWKPRYFTEKGNPKLTHNGEPCPSLNEIDSHIGQDIALWYILNHRKSQINGWISAMRPSQRIAQSCITIGTPTYRFTHRVVVNVPKAASSVVFGKQMRSLFTVPKGKVLVGHDASGLELRMLAHYINNPEYTKIIVEQDPHTYHQRLAGLATRDQAKTFIYGFNYGAGDLLIGIGVNNDLDELRDKYHGSLNAKLRQIKQRSNKSGMIPIGKGSFIPANQEMALRALDGGYIKETFLKYNPDLSDLINRVQSASERGWLLGLDGRRVQMRRDFGGKVQIHKALNTLLQSAGAVVMKHSIVILDRLIQEHGLHSIKVIDMHDEAEFECLPEEADKHAELAVQSIKEAGVLLGLNCPLDAEAHIGRTWRDVH